MKHWLKSLVSWLTDPIRPEDRNTTVEGEPQPQEKRADRICDAVIGLDFGTSCTKIVLRTPYERDRAFAIPFDEAAHRSSPYLLPSSLWVDRHGRVSLTSLREGHCIRDIKYYLMRSRREHVVTDNGALVKFEANSVAVAFLALALNYTRRWFLHTHKNSYGHFAIEWHFNLGLPSKDFTNTALCNNYLRIAAAAWRLSFQNSPIDLATAKTTFDAVELGTQQSDNGVGLFLECGESGSAEVYLIPEVAAEVKGYARSHLREDGLHILMDIGAGTLDICSFILHQKQGDDCYELLTTDVRELGAMILHKKRVEVIRQSVSEKDLRRLEHWDPIEPIPSNIEQDLPINSDVLNRLHVSDSNYSKQCSQMFWQTLINLKTKRDPHSRRWKDSMPVFVCGGARDMKFYRELLGTVSKKLQTLYSPCLGLEQLKLPKPTNLEANISEDEYHRLAVAWGLSYPETDIGEVTRPGDISNIPPPRPTKPPHPFVSKDMV